VLFTQSSHHKRQYAGQHQETSREKGGRKNSKTELKTAMSRQLRIRLKLGVKFLRGEVPWGKEGHIVTGEKEHNSDVPSRSAKKKKSEFGRGPTRLIFSFWQNPDKCCTIKYSSTSKIHRINYENMSIQIRVSHIMRRPLISFSNLPNLSSRTTALELTQPVAKLSTRNLSGG
jgi:hypothetical protein